METIGDQIIAILKEHLPAKLTAIQAEHQAADLARSSTGNIELVLTHIPNKNYLFGARDITSEKPPFLIVTGVDVDFPDSVNYDDNSMHSDNQKFIIECYINTDHLERGQRKIYRYGKAIAQTLQQYSRVDGLASAGAVSDIKYRFIETPQRRFLPACVIEANYKVLSDANNDYV